MSIRLVMRYLLRVFRIEALPLIIIELISINLNLIRSLIKWLNQYIPEPVSPKATSNSMMMSRVNSPTSGKIYLEDSAN